MEKISKKISYIEKTINKMQKEITTIKKTYNTNATNSFNNSSNYIHNSAKMCKNKLLRSKKPYSQKNYFQLSEKEKKYYGNKNRLENPHSFNIKKKQLNLNNHISDYSFDTNNNVNNENEKNQENFGQNTKIRNDDKRFDRMSILREEMNEKKDINESIFENNFGFKSHNIFFNYNLNGENKRVNSVFSNFARKNKNEKRKNNYKNLSVEEHFNRTNKINKKTNAKLYHFKQEDIEQSKNNTNIYNINNKNNDNDNNYMQNSEDISFLKSSNSYIEPIKLKKNEKKILDSNSIKNKNLGNNYFILNGNNQTFNKNNENNNYELYNKYNNLIFDKNNNKENHNYNQEENIEERYSEILNILGDYQTEEINNKAILFDKYGSMGFEQYLNNQKIINNSSIVDSNDIYGYLLRYKNFIESLRTKNEYNYLKQINSYKNLCNKLLSEADSTKIQKLAKKINYKLEKNQHNKRVLEKIKNILVKLKSNNTSNNY